MGHNSTSAYLLREIGEAHVFYVHGWFWVATDHSGKLQLKRKTIE